VQVVFVSKPGRPSGDEQETLRADPKLLRKIALRFQFRNPPL
jgi:hypothetical protein